MLPSGIHRERKAMLMGDELRAAIRGAYEESRAQLATDDPPEVLAPWEQLSLGMRLAFIYVFAAGRQVGADEERNRDLPPSHGKN